MNIFKSNLLHYLLLLPLLLLGAGALAQDDAIGKYLGKYLDDPRFTLVSVSPKMFRLMTKIDWDTASPHLKETISRLQSLRILSTETTPRQFYGLAKGAIDRKEYEELIAY